jgi:endoglucanase
MKTRMVDIALCTMSAVLPGCASSGVGVNKTTVAATPVQQHGLLKAAGNKIVDKTDTPVRLVGMSLFWPVWGGERFFTKEVVDWLVTDWKCTLLRAPVAVDPKGGYLDNAGASKARVREVVDAAIANGVYVLIDWHEEHADQHVEQAQAFFEDMAKSYGDKPNVIFEIWNEPAGKSEPIPTWPQIKAYAESIIPIIRRHSANLIVVGTPAWSQRVDVAADDPVAGSNIAYSFHFYAGSHGRELRDKADYALGKGIALFITEWGTSIADGGNADKRVYGEAADEWLGWADDNKLSWANWSVMDKDEASSILRPQDWDENRWPNLDPDKGHWPMSRLSASGRWVREQIAKARIAPATAQPAGSQARVPSAAKPSR